MDSIQRVGCFFGDLESSAVPRPIPSSSTTRKMDPPPPSGAASAFGVVANAARGSGAPARRLRRQGALPAISLQGGGADICAPPIFLCRAPPNRPPPKRRGQRAETGELESRRRSSRNFQQGKGRRWPLGPRSIRKWKGRQWDAPDRRATRASRGAAAARGR